VSVAKLFPDAERTDPKPIRAAETDYGFIQRVDDPAFARIRGLLNDWFERFASTQPAEATNYARGCFRAKQDGQFWSAFWELYLHELFCRLGFSASVHPESERGTKPDFELTRGGDRFYLEAVMPTPKYGERGNKPAIAATVREYVADTFRRQFRLRLRYLIAGKGQPRKVEVTDAVGGWLDSLDWAELWTGDPNTSGKPEADLRVGDGWQIGLAAIPLDPSLQSENPRPMIWIERGAIGYPDGLGQAVLPSLEDKSTRYGELDAPLVIALWVSHALANNETAPLALFDGYFPVEDGRHATGLELNAERKGLWTPGAKTRGRAAGLLAVNAWTFSYVSVGQSMPHYWPNPWADQALSVELPFATSAVTDDEREVANSPATLNPAELFELERDWPGEAFENAYD
jgi:hypothetical protein